MKTRNVITDNCEKIRPEYQPATVRFDYTKGSQATVTTKKNTMFVWKFSQKISCTGLLFLSQ